MNLYWPYNFKRVVIIWVFADGVHFQCLPRLLFLYLWDAVLIDAFVRFFSDSKFWVFVPFAIKCIYIEGIKIHQYDNFHTFIKTLDFSADYLWSVYLYFNDLRSEAGCSQLGRERCRFDSGCRRIMFAWFASIFSKSWSIQHWVLYTRCK